MLLNANWSNNTNIYFNFRAHLTNYTQRSPWEANIRSFSGSQEIGRILRNRKSHYGVYNSLPQFPIISQVNPFHTFPLHCDDAHFNIILQCNPVLKTVARLQVSPPKPRMQFVILD